MLTHDQLAQLEQSIYNAAMAGDMRTGLALLKLYDDDLELERQECGAIILPAVDIDAYDDDYIIDSHPPPFAEYLSETV